MLKNKTMIMVAPLFLIMGNHAMAEEEAAAASVERGAEVFDNCSVCHGDYAEVGEDYGAPKLAGQLDWYLMRQLRNFRAEFRGTKEGDEFGPVMQPMAADLSDQEIEDVVAYIETLDSNYEPDAE